jgi:protein tyrosine phosphatase
MKFDIYWPKNENENLQINEYITIKLDSELELMEDSVIIRNFSIIINNEDGKKIINIQQIHIICWNDHTIPKAEVGYKALDAVMTLIDDYLKENKKSIVIHCR